MFRKRPPSDDDDLPPCPADSDHSPPDSGTEPQLTTRERSTEQPERVGLKGAGRFRNRLLGTGNDASESQSNSSRAQTSIDFVVGASVFLLTVAFVVAFLPGVFEPFTGSGEGDVVTADRTASLLAEQLLAEPTNPGALDSACTAEFFDANGDGADGVPGCQYDTDADDLDTALGLGATTSVQVTIEENGSVHSIGSVTLSAGPEPPETQSVVVSRRVVLLDGEERDLFVRVW